MSAIQLPAAAQQVPQLPDSTGWGVHVLALARGPDSALWVGTYQQGIFVLRPGATQWEHITTSRDTAAHAISFDFVHAFAFGPRGQVWYGTVGNGWGLSTDNGKTWRNWTGRELGKEWLYVTPKGIVTRGETTYIATADGIKLTGDDGATWWVIVDSAASASGGDSIWGHLPDEYAVEFDYGPPPPSRVPATLTVNHLRGFSRSLDGGRTWESRTAPDGCGRSSACALPAFTSETVRGMARGEGVRPRFPENVWLAEPTAALPDLLGTRVGIVGKDVRSWPGPAIPGSPARAAAPMEPRHTWFERPIALADNPYIDQTYRFGSTMGGFFQPHQGVEFNNPDGTPVHTIGDGTVMHAGPAEQGALTVAIRHDRTLTTRDAQRTLYSVYYHNSKLLVTVGQHVKAGDVISLVGNTGRATNDHLHLEIHALPADSVRLAVDPDVRYPPFNTNPELWIAPLPGTGLVAGQVWDSQGKQVPQSRIYGLVKPEPQETPFSFIETYGPRNHSDPVYQEHFAISDVPPGEYVLGVEIEGKRVFRRVRVAAGKLTWVEFRP